MAAAIVAVRINNSNSDEERERRHYQSRKIMDQTDDEVRIASQINNQDTPTKTGMGYMWYKLNCKYGVCIPNFKVIHAGYKLNQIFQSLEETVRFYIGRKQNIDLLIYQIKGIDPSLASYNIVTSSSNPCVFLKIRPKCDNLFWMKGNDSFIKIIYQKINFMAMYREYRKQLIYLTKQDLTRLYIETFNKKSPKIFSMSRMRSRLLNYKLNKLLTE